MNNLENKLENFLSTFHTSDIWYEDSKVEMTSREKHLVKNALSIWLYKKGENL